MNISASVKKVVEENIELLESGNHDNLVVLFETCDVELSCAQQEELVSLLKELGMNIDSARSEAFLNNFRNSVDYYLNNPDPQDVSNSWSRFSYILDNLSWLGYSYDELVELVRANQKELGINLRSIDSQYGWNTSDEYDLGWFKADKFDGVG